MRKMLPDFWLWIVLVVTVLSVLVSALGMEVLTRDETWAILTCNGLSIFDGK